jgi:peptidoglycan/LPS O-acetylase OafA/YrhL
VYSTCNLKGARAHLWALDGLRGVAALAVLAFHVSFLFRLPWQPQHAPLAVDFFFGLSGFVIAHAYDAPFAQGRLNLREFARKRLIRLYPMILLGVALGGVSTFLSATHGAPKPLSEVAILTLSAALLLPTGVLFDLHAFVVNQPLWSLFFEGIANAIYGVSAVKRRFEAPSMAWLAFSAALLIVVACHYGTIAGLGFERSYWFVGGVARLAFPFLTGVLICRSKLYLKAPQVPDFMLVAALATVLFGPSTRFDLAYQLIAILLVFPAIIACGVNPRSTPATSRAWIVLGELSYPLYAIHAPLIEFVSKAHNHAARFTTWEAAAVSIPVAIGAAWLALAVYDRPVRSWLGQPRTRRRGLLPAN